MLDAADPSNAFSPYVLIPSSGPEPDPDHGGAVRALLLDRAIQQVHRLLEAVDRSDLDRLPPVLRSLHHETRGGLTRTVTAMVAALERFLTRKRHASVRELLDPALRPMTTFVHGVYAVTSPALLVVQSILYSHCEWFQDCLWEVHSAVRAYGELRQIGYPEEHCRFIAAIIAHQTLARTVWTLDIANRQAGSPGRGRERAVKDTTETFAYIFQQTGGDGDWQAAPIDPSEPTDLCGATAVAQAIARTLFAFLPPTPARSGRVDGSPQRRRLAAALTLHCLCLQSRHQRREDPNAIIPIATQAFAFCGALMERADPPDGPQPGLIHIHYGRYLDRSNHDLLTAIRNYAFALLTQTYGPTHQEASAPVSLYLCLPRVSTSRVWNHRRFAADDLGERGSEPPSDRDYFRPAEPSRLPNAHGTAIAKAIEDVVGDVRSYRMCNSDATQGLPDMLRCNLGLAKPDDGRPQPNDLGSLREAVIRTHLAYLGHLGSKSDQPPRGYLPTPLVGHLLRCCRDARPDDYRALHLIAEDPRVLISPRGQNEQFTVWIPANAPKLELPKELWSAGFDENLDALIARYAAAMMIGILVSFAPRRLILDYLGECEAIEKWKALIAAAFAQNGGPLMTLYSAQVRARRSQVDQSGNPAPGMAPAASLGGVHEPLRILGIDAGGTSIKYQSFEVEWILSPDGRSGRLSEPKAKSGVPAILWSELKIDPTADSPERRLVKELFGEAGQEIPVQSAGATAPDATHPGEQKHNPQPPKGIDAIGIAYPGPIADGVPVGVSGVFKKLGGDHQIAKGNPHTLHRLDFARCAARIPGLEAAVVSVINDGEADIRASEDSAEPGGEGVHVVLKEGTGVAFAVFADGRPVERLAETAKAVLNLLDGPPEHDFQKGVLSGFLSKNKVQTLLPKAHKCLTDLLTPRSDSEVAKSRAKDILNRTLGRMLSAAQGNEVLTFEKALTDELAAELGPDVATREISAKVAEKVRSAGTGLVDRFKEALQRCHEESRYALVLDQAEQAATLTAQTRDDLRNHGQLEPPANSEPSTDPPKKIESGSPRAWDALGDDEKAAIGLAWVLGRWLADAVALTWDLYQMRRIKLAGGPLKGATGIYVTSSARRALEEVYGFQLDSTAGASDWYASSRRREVKALHIKPPPYDSDEAGPRGAALAARDGFVANLKGAQLRICRQHLSDFDVGTPFRVADLMDKAAKDLGGLPWVVSPDEVADMLEAQSAELALTRQHDGAFRRLPECGHSPV